MLPGKGGRLVRTDLDSEEKHRIVVTNSKS